jgi:hypothetical protein
MGCGYELGFGWAGLGGGIFGLSTKWIVWSSSLIIFPNIYSSSKF